MIKRIGIVLYGVGGYLAFLGSILYAIAFVEGVWVPRTIDAGGASGPLWLDVVVDVALLALFGLQHSVMARPGFKAAWTRVVPKSIERSTYVYAASLCLVVLFVAWRPIPTVVWSLESPALRTLLVALSLLGWGTAFVSTFLINHFELLGLKQVVHAARGANLPAHQFRTPALYRLVRHPIYMGFLVAFWATPTMTASHLLFAVVMLAYVRIGIHFEERDLVREYGDQYLRYREEVRGLVPLPRLGEPARPGTTATR